ncbi:HEAT repeat domain-containing protein [Embleya sp. NPDC005971]|uniref:HEAT repeat domain-containing protein n=1 Tax=Embleya sp. NPDC005971 TaxID=3156724 RepID=UPI00340D5641
MDVVPDGIDDLIVSFLGGDNRAGARLVAAGPVSLHRLIGALAVRVDPGRDAPGARGERCGREEFEHLDRLERLLVRAFPEALFDAVAHDRTLESAVMRMLKSVDDPRAVPILERGLHPDSGARWSALCGLAVHGTADHTEAVVDCLDDASELTRSEAFDVLGRLGDARAIEPLLRRLSADDAHTARRASAALDRIERRIGGPLAPPVWLDMGPRELTTGGAAPFGEPWRVMEGLVERGRTVRDGEVLAVLENDYVSTELTAPGPGTVTDVRISVGDEVSDEVVAVVLQTRRRIG